MNAILKAWAAAALLLPLAAAAQDYPNRLIRIVAPFPPGASTDILARTVGRGLTEAWRQQVVVDNRPGASGMVGADMVAKAQPDGYTLLMASTTEVAIVQSLHGKMTYDPATDLTPVTLAGIAPLALVIHPSIPAQSLKEFIEIARARPGQLSFGSAGNGSPQHLSGELLKSMARVDLIHVPYKGGAPAVADVVAGQISACFCGIAPALPHLKAGKLRVLAVSTASRARAAPEVPTMQEAGVPGFETSIWFGVFAPAGTPPDIIRKLNVEIAGTLTQRDVSERLADQGLDAVGNSPAEFDAFFKSEIAKYATVIRELGTKLD